MTVYIFREDIDPIDRSLLDPEIHMPQGSVSRALGGILKFIPTPGGSGQHILRVWWIWSEPGGLMLVHCM